MTQPIVAIVGRPNIGKSTIFNRLAGERIAIVEDIPGVTRDRIYAHSEWLGRDFSIIDTGGITMENEPLMEQVRAQAEIAIEEADVIIFMTNVRQGVTDLDEEVGQLLFRSKKPVVLAVNKVDNPEQKNDIYEFYALGFGEPFPISGSHGLGLGDLLDEVVSHFPEQEEAEEDDGIIRFSLIGRPNVGKSSLVNAIIGEERVIVSDVAGTTRDAIDTSFVTEDGREFNIIDTAGIRKRGKVYESTEKYSVMRSLRAIERSDVVLCVLNGEEGIREQDKRVVGYAMEAGKGLIILVNKWDLVEKDNKTFDAFEKKIRNEFPFISYAPILFVSALTKQRLSKLPDLIEQISNNHKLRIQSSLLNEVITDAVAMNPTPTDKGRRLRIYYSTQVAIKPPTFILFVNDPELMHFSYLRYLENRIRETFVFEGTPIRLICRQRK